MLHDALPFEPDGQTLRHAPQFNGSFVVFAHVVPHMVVLPAQVHVPAALHPIIVGQVPHE